MHMSFIMTLLKEMIELFSAYTTTITLVVIEKLNIIYILHFLYNLTCYILQMQLNNWKFIIFSKLLIFGTVMLWESFIVGNSEQLSHSITVPNLNSLVNIWMGLLSTIESQS